MRLSGEIAKCVSDPARPWPTFILQLLEKHGTSQEEVQKRFRIPAVTVEPCGIELLPGATLEDIAWRSGIYLDNDGKVPGTPKKRNPDGRFRLPGSAAPRIKGDLARYQPLWPLIAGPEKVLDLMYIKRPKHLSSVKLEVRCIQFYFK